MHVADALHIARALPTTPPPPVREQWLEDVVVALAGELDRLHGLLETIAEQLQGVDGDGPVSTTDENGNTVSTLDEDTWSTLCAEVWP